MRTFASYKLAAILLASFLFLLIFPAKVQAQAWYNASWSYRKAITIDYTKVGTGPHTNFPVLISITDADLKASAQATGNDILFTSADGVTKISHEIETYTTATGVLVAWVEVPSLSSATNTVIYMYYGNAAAANQQNVTGTWDASFSGVYHMNTFSDATSNARNGANIGTIAATGQIGAARGFVISDGADKITIAGLMGNPVNSTLSGWANLISVDNNGSSLISMGDVNAIVMDDRTAGCYGFYYNNPGGWYSTVASPRTYYADSKWHYIVYTTNDAGNAQKLYVDGVLNTTTAFTPSITYSGQGANTIIGRHGNGQTTWDFNGTIDEVRVASTDRSAGWILTEYNNQSLPGTFFSVGNQTAACSGTNLLLNPGFEIPVVPNLNSATLENIQTGTTWGNWTVSVANGFNVVKVNGAGYVNGPDRASDGFQYIDIASAAGNLSQTFTLAQPASISFSGNFANRQSASGSYIPWSGYIQIINASAAVVATSNTVNMIKTMGDEAWQNASGNIATLLPAGTYTYKAFLGDWGHFDNASVYINTTVSGTSTPTCVGGGSTGTITATATGGYTPYTYSLNGGAYQASATFTGLAAGSYTLTAKSNTGCISSGTATVTVIDFGTSPDNQNLAGTNTWVGHVYDGIAFNNYIGNYTEAESFNESFAGTATCFNLSSNAATVSIYTETFSVKYRMNSTKVGLYVADLGSDDGSRLTVDGVLIYNNWNDQGFVLVPGALLNLNGASSLLYEYYENAGGNQVAFQNLTLLLANNLSTNMAQNVCIGNTGSAISGDVYGTLPAGITLSGTGYQWTYSTTAGGARTNISGATAATYSPSAAAAPFNVAGTYYIYRNAVLSSTNNVSPNPYIATDESNATTITVAAAPAATINYAGNPFCSTAGTGTVTRTGSTGGVYSSPAGLTINAATGDITISSSTAGAYTVTYTMAAAGGCSIQTAIASVTITTLPAAVISYTGSPFCKSIGTAQPVTQTGTAGGTYSAAAGLTINGATGAVTPSTSTAGTYTVTYTMPGTGGCSAQSASVSVTITTLPVATISYSGTPYCTSLGTAQPVTQTGTAGGVYSSTAGLIINSSTGAITPNTSTAGTYTVTYTMTAAGCTAQTAAASVTVTALPAATITYIGMPFCISTITAQSVTRTGTAGGVYSSTVGLTINSGTGAITPNTSTAGTYTVTYTMAAASGCAAQTTTASVTVTALPAAIISYSGSPYCTSVATAQPVTQTGTAGGVYSSTAGLTINSSTGAITPGTSTAGTYTVTYAMAATGGCAIQTATASVTINTMPSATINYAGSPYCSSAGTATVTSTGTAGGTYTSTAGLIINASTGDITLSSSTANTYTVTYTIAAAAGCAAYSTTASITITTQPYATGYYAGTPYCSNGGVVYPSGTFTGALGTLTSTAGLSINSSNGGVDLGASTAGSYIVTYSVAASGGCAIYSTTTPIVISTAPAGTINYTGSPFCSNAGTATVTRTGTAGGVYSSTAGLTINTVTGDITLLSSTAGAYTVTYTISASGGCAVYTTTASVTITTAPSATISYAGTPYCSNAGTASVTRTGTTGGVYSSTAGLIINAATGDITLLSSTAGPYTVTYTIAAAGGCAVLTTTASVTITTAPAATISYAGTPYCTNAGTATVTRTGTTGGVYSSTAGLTINAATGDITLLSSTAGAYTVTYTIAAAAGCPVLTTTASVTITMAPAATISYAGNPYCANAGPATVTQTGTATGTYSAAAGLTINTTTGTITPGTSTAGTYTVSYIIGAAGGCSGLTVSTSVTITTLPAATISYSGSPYCTSNGTAQSVTQTGTTGGVYSSTAGLTINSSTGAITPNTSTAGTYTVTYTMTAAGCTAQTATASVTVTALPAATISYTGTPFCINVSTAQAVTQAGSAGGIYTSTAGLTINSSTGAIIPNTSTAGTYTVTYTMSAAAGCAAQTATASVTITTLPAATIAYSGSPFCTSLGTGQSVTLTGTSGGVYSSTAGLTIDAGTGAIIPGTSTAGTYTVTYTMAASGCTAQTASTSVTITKLPAAAISYSGTPFCSSSVTAQSVTLTGTTGGVYSSTAGLIINAGTGAITPGTSTAGTYTVTYTMTAGGGCSAQTATTSVTITKLPAATISYSGTPFCTSLGTGQSVSLTGTAGGVYSSTAGLNINTGTGDITPGLSTPGAYTVTYTMAAAGGCAVQSTTTSVTITQIPTTANAGADQTGAATCGSTTVTLGGNTPAIGTGAWSIISGAGGTVTTPASATSTFSGTAGTSYTLRWTISNAPCTASTDDVIIAFNLIQVTATSGTLNACYSSLKLAFDGINNGTHQGAITVNVNGSSAETVAAVLNASGTGGSSYTSVNIYPTATGLTISGNLNTPLIDLSGANNVTIDGRVNATGTAKDLTLINTNTGTAASTIRFINSAGNNSVKYCTVKGATLATAGGVIFFSTSAAGIGNDNNTIDNCNLTGADNINRPVNIIYSSGTSTRENNSDVISNNNIYDFLRPGATSYGLDLLTFTSDWNISGNSFYETTAFIPAGAFTYRPIYIANALGNNYSVTGNYIGGSAPQCGGSAWTMSAAAAYIFYGIEMSAGTTTASSVQNNTIKNFDVTSTSAAPWVGIRITAGNVNIGTVTGNTIGSATGNGSVTITNTTLAATSYGIYISSTGTINVSANTIGSVTAAGSSAIPHSFTGIFKTGAGATTISNNILGSSTTASSIQASTSSTGAVQNVYGINSAGTGSVTISGNTIANLYNAYLPATAVTGQVAGIYTSGTGVYTVQNNIVHDLSTTSPNTAVTNAASVIGISEISTGAGKLISGNTIYNLSNTAATAAVSVIGLYYSGATTGTNTVSGNFIHSLSLSSSDITSSIYGIKVAAGATTYSNNIINLGTGITTGYAIYGIYETGAASNNINLYFNTVYIGGAATGTTLSTYAVFNNATTNVKNIRNNIFDNVRAGGVTGKHYAIRLAGSASITIDYNDYYAPNGVLGFNGSDVTILPIVAGQDGSSSAIDPLFANAGGTSPANYLPSASSFAGISGTGILTDFNGTVRSLTTPSIGAFEYAISGVINVTSTSGTATAGSYITLKRAFDGINNGTHQGVITIKVNGSTTESAAAVLNGSGTGSAIYTSVNIYPTATGYTISGNLNTPLIDLNGANNVTIDGRVNATGTAKDLTLINTNTGTAASTIRFINSAGNNSVKYCTVKGASLATAGGVIFFSTSAAGIGNDNNTIDNCNLTGADNINRPVNILYSLGTTLHENSSDVISNNNFYDFLRPGATSYGIDLLTFTSDWTISGNSFYETSSFIPSGAFTYRAISIANASGNNFIVSGNYIGGSAPQCGGSAWTMSAAAAYLYYGIEMSVGTTSTSSVQNNTIKNFNVTSTSAAPWVGIRITAGNVNIGTVTGNTIGSATGNGSVTITNTTLAATSYGIYISSTGTINVSANTIGSVTAAGSSAIPHSFTGIFKTGAGTTTISNNILGSSTTASSIQASTSSTGAVQNVNGINSAGTGSVTISGNTIANLYNAYLPASSATGQVVGISTSGTGNYTIQNNIIRDLSTTSPNTAVTNAASVIGISDVATGTVKVISGNKIYNLSNTAATAAVSIIGLYYSGATTGTNTVSGNFIHSLSLSSSAITAGIYGIKIAAGTTTYSNNIINLGAGITRGYVIYGFYETGAVSNNTNLYFNTVYIGGTTTGAVSLTYALYNNANTNTRDFRNNIFYNGRSTASASNTHFAISIAGTTGLTIDYNDYFANGTGGTICRLVAVNYSTLALWQTAVSAISGDVNSLNINPGFATAGGTNPGDYSPDQILTGVDGTGITSDYFGIITRPAPPKMGALDCNSNPTVTSTTPASRCGTGTVILTATATAGAIVNWYDALTGGNLIGTGTSFTTAVISITTIYYADATYPACRSSYRTAVTATVVPLPAGTISGTVSVCRNSTSPNITFTGDNGTAPYIFTYTINGGAPQTITSGAGSNPVLVTVAVPTNIAGTFTYIFSNIASTGANTCTQTVADTAIVTITLLPAAVISYTGSPYCSTSGIVAVNFTGTTGGIYSSTAGLTINAGTGAITPGTSTAGTYTVTYTMAAAGGCAQQTASASVTITTLPAASISYSGTPFCNSLSSAQTVTRSGNTGGVYTSTAGLTINSSTGDIIPNTSTAGIYTVTYTMAATGGCAAQTATSSVTITTLPSATISYSGSPFCKSVGTAQSVTQTGTAGGVYSSTAGLTIDVSTGAIIPGTSVAGTYTVTYTLAAAGGCAAQTATASVTITANPSATFSYAGSPYLVTAGTASATFSGTTGGIYSSTAGLSLNASTGDVILGTSTLGTYTVTYTVAAAEGCAVYTTTAGITINVTTKIFTGTGNFSDPARWTSGTLPNAGENLIIDGACTVDNSVVTDNVPYGTLTVGTATARTLNWAVGGTNRLNIAGVFAGTAVSILDMTNGGTLIIRGAGNSTNLTFIPGTGTLEYQCNRILPAEQATYNNLIINGTGITVSLGAITTFTGNITITSGAFTANNFNLSIKGNWTNNSAANAFTAGTATVTFNNTIAQSISGTFATTFNNLTIANTASTVSLNVNTAISGNLSVTNGTFDIGVYTANRSSAGGTLVVANNAILNIGGTNTFPTNYTTNTLSVSSTVAYSGTNQTVAAQTYGNLTLSSASGAAIKTLSATDFAIVGNLASTLGAGTSVTFNAASNITINGDVSIGVSTTFNGGSYSHSVGGNWINNGTFNGNTGTITFTGPGKLVSGSGVQNFNNLTIAASSIGFPASPITVTGNLATISSGSFTFVSGGTLLMTGSGKTISGSGIVSDNLTISGSVTTAASFTIAGNFSVSGSFTASAGSITLSGTSKTISGTGTKLFASLIVTGSITSNADFSVSSALTVSGVLSASAGTATFTNTSSLSGTANLFNVTINGIKLQLSANSTLGIANTFTITAGTLDAATSGFNTVNFNGTVAQNINGIAYSNLILSNGNTKTAAGNITTAYHLTIGTGTSFDAGVYTHSIYGNWINNGTFTAGTSTVQFLGPATAFISGVPTAFNILTSNTSSASTQLILQTNVTAAIVNMTVGTITTGTNTITITNTRTGIGNIYGTITRTHAFTTGTAYAFKNNYNTITFASVSGVSSITVYVKDEPVSDFPLGGAINVLYDITVPAGTYNATLRLNYEDDELNGVDESTMGLWNYNGTDWFPFGKSANDTASNWIEQSGLTNITNRWTCGTTPSAALWTGAVSSDWSDAANWYAALGSASTPPSATDAAAIGFAAFNYQPIISTAVKVKNVYFGNVQAVTLSMSAGGSLTSGDIAPGLTGNVRHTINANNQTITINGNLTLGDTEFVNNMIDVNIGSGTVAVLGSLIQTGGASINFTNSGTLKIHKNFNRSNGTFIAGNGTVEYNGDENQSIATVNYNNLTVNKSAGIATIDSVANIDGNVLISSGQLDNLDTMRITGNVTIATGAIFQNSNSLYVGGNWLNSGMYNSNASGTYVTFNGTGPQTISATTFNTLEFNKPVGSVATLTGDVTLRGDLFGTSGTLDTKSYFFNRDVEGGTAIMGDFATLIIAADNAPNKFASYIMAPTSTVVFNGTGTQHLLLPGLIYGNLTFRNSGNKILYTPITVNGNLSIESGANFDAAANTITLNGNWINNGTFTPSGSTVLLGGTSKTVTGITTFNRVSVYGSYTFLSNLTFDSLLNINSGGSIISGSAIQTTINGDISNSGVINATGTTTITGNVEQNIRLINAATTVLLRLIINGSVSPVINSTSSPQFGYITINNTAGVTSTTGVTVLYGLTIGPGGIYNGGIYSHNILGDVTNNGTFTSTGTLNFIPSIARTVNLGSDFSSTGIVNFGGVGVLTLANSPLSFHNVQISNTNPAGITPVSDWNIDNNVTINSGAIFNAGSHTYFVGNDILNNGTVNSGTSTFSFNGSTDQIVTAMAFYNLDAANTGGIVRLLNATVNNNLSVNTGTMSIGNTSAARTITVSKNITIASGATLNVDTASNATHQLTLGGNIINSGTLNLRPDANSLCNVTFNKNGNQTISGTGGTTKFNNITVNMGTIDTNHLDVTATNFSAPNGFLTLNNGSFNLNSATDSITPFINNIPGGNYLIPATAGLWLNAGAINSPAMNWTVAGSVKVTGGTMTMGMVSDNAVIPMDASRFTIAGSGTLNLASRISNPGAAWSLAIQGAGVLTINDRGSTASGEAPFNMDATSCSFSMSGGNLIIKDAGGSAGQNLGYNNLATAGTGFTGGTLQIGNPLTTASQIFGLVSTRSIYNLNVSSANATAILQTPVLTVSNNVTVTAGVLDIDTLELKIGGAISNSGTFTVSKATIEMNGTSAQTIPAAAFSGNNIKALNINNNAGVTLGGILNLTDVITVANGSLASGGYLTLKSTADATARIAPITSLAATPISGNVIAERYVPGRRKYRFITSPVTTSATDVLTAGQESLSIWGNWQNSGINTTPLVGNFITGGTLADGFDQQTQNNSLFTYDAANLRYVGYSSANGKNTKYTSLKAGIAYFMFVYGDRMNSIGTSNPHNTVISATGTIKSGDQVYTTSSAIPLSPVTGRFTLLGNPYASPINWATVTKTDLENTFWGWDPNLSSTGGYVTVTTLGNVTLIAPFSGTTGLNQYIQSGQGFFVKTAGPSPVLTLHEQDKVSNFNRNAFRVSGGVNNVPLLAVNLLYASGLTTVLSDGVLAVFDPSFSKQAGTEDAVKMPNLAENISVTVDTSSLSVDATPLPLNNDTLYLNIARLTKAQYTLQIFAQQMTGTGIQAYLQDKYLNTLQALSLTDTNSIVININTAIPASVNANRFRIVFHSSVVPLPVTYTSIKASKKNLDVEVEWQVAEESGIQKYEIEKSADGIYFYTAGTVAARGNNSTEVYDWLDTNPVTGNNYYRVRAIQADGSFILSKTVLVRMDTGGGTFKVYPNPVLNQQFNIWANQVPKGKYGILLYNRQGQKIIYQEIDHPGGTFNQIIHLNIMTPAGIYYLQISSETVKYNQTLFLE